MSDFVPLTIESVEEITEESRRINFRIPKEHSAAFRFIPGQYITFRQEINGEELRRSYSICTSPEEDIVSVGIKRVEGGRFSNFAMNLKAGDILDTMTPEGGFHIADPQAENYLFVAAGSGITPILSMIKSLLSANPRAEVTLIFGNKNTSSIMFIEELEDLKNLYMSRFQLIFVLSRETGEYAINNGRIDPDKARYLLENEMISSDLEGVYLCGPSQMIMSMKAYFVDEMNMDVSKIHYELFNTDGLESNTEYQKNLSENSALRDQLSQVNIELDGRKYQLELRYDGQSILDAAMETGADLPFACKGGVCCTCRAKVLEGEVDMEKNFALEPDEVEQGFVLTCQSHPKSETVTISFDYK